MLERPLIQASKPGHGEHRALSRPPTSVRPGRLAISGSTIQQHLSDHLNKPFTVIAGAQQAATMLFRWIVQRLVMRGYSVPGRCEDGAAARKKKGPPKRP